LLRYGAASEEDHEVGDAADLEAACDLRIFFRVHFQHYRPARHVRRGSRDFGRGCNARPAPARPEIHEYRHRRVLHDFIEQLIVHSERLGDWRQQVFTEAAATAAGQELGWNAVLLSAMAAGANDGQKKPP
jgi:hypothetical protein